MRNLVNVKELQKDDYDNGIFILLQSLTKAPKIPRVCFDTFVTSLGDTHQVFVIRNSDEAVVAAATCLIESKLIRGGQGVAHVEDVVIHPDYRKRGLASRLLSHIVSHALKMNCYKVILNCSEANTSFYQKHKFKKVDNGMAIYF